MPIGDNGDNIAAGETTEAIVHGYNVEEPDIQAALQYAAGSGAGLPRAAQFAPGASRLLRLHGSSGPAQPVERRRQGTEAHGSQNVGGRAAPLRWSAGSLSR